MKRKTVVFYESYYDAIEDLPEKQQLKVYQTIFSYIWNLQYYKASDFAWKWVGALPMVTIATVKQDIHLMIM